VVSKTCFLDLFCEKIEKNRPKKIKKQKSAPKKSRFSKKRNDFGVKHGYFGNFGRPKGWIFLLFDAQDCQREKVDSPPMGK